MLAKAIYVALCILFISGCESAQEKSLPEVSDSIFEILDVRGPKEGGNANPKDNIPDSNMEELPENLISKDGKYIPSPGYSWVNPIEEEDLRVIKFDETDDSIKYYYQGLAYYYLEGKDWLIEYPDKALEINPKLTIEYFNRVIEDNPKFAWAYLFRANANYMKGNLKSAIRDYSLAIENNSEIEETYHNRGSALMEIGKIDEAIRDFDKAISINPESYETYYLRGQARFKKDNMEGATADYNMSITTAPKFFIYPYLQRGILRLKKQDYDGAIEDQFFVEQNDDEAEAYYYWACALAHKEQKWGMLESPGFQAINSK